MMDLLYCGLCSLGSLAAIFIVTKLMGNRQLAQLNFFDYINGITIGSIAAEMATDIEEFEKPLLAIFIYGAVSILVSFLTNKSLKIRRVMEGKTLLLFQEGKVFEKNLMKAGIDIEEFLALCRLQGYFNLEEIHTIYLETNGQISILPMEKKRPTTPEDFEMNPQQEMPVATVIVDGTILHKNLQYYGRDLRWLEKQLQTQGVKNKKDVILATCDHNHKLTVYQKTKVKKTESIFE